MENHSGNSALDRRTPQMAHSAATTPTTDHSQKPAIAQHDHVSGATKVFWHLFPMLHLGGQ
jgi:hypothetical protein